MSDHPAPGPSTDAELDRLRRRAYGRDPDIQHDPEAVARLRALEAAGLPSASDRTRTPAGSAALGDTPPGPGEPDAATGPLPTSATPDAPSPASIRRRRVAVLWIASVVVAVIATVAATALLEPGDPREVATLPLSAEDVPAAMANGLGGATASADFYGLTVVAEPGGASGRAVAYVSDCLYVVPTDSAGDGFLFSGCGAGGFPATAQVTVSSLMPSELTDAFPAGSALQFVLDGSRVHVLTDTR